MALFPPLTGTRPSVLSASCVPVLFTNEPDRALGACVLRRARERVLTPRLAAQTEPEAREKYGDDQIKIYKSTFTALYYSMMEADQKEPTAMKMICAGPEEKVVGLHLIGLGSDEMLQGFAVAIKMGGASLALASATAHGGCRAYPCADPTSSPISTSRFILPLSRSCHLSFPVRSTPPDLFLLLLPVPQPQPRRRSLTTLSPFTPRRPRARLPLFEPPKHPADTPDSSPQRSSRCGRRRVRRSRAAGQESEVCGGGEVLSPVRLLPLSGSLRNSDTSWIKCLTGRDRFSARRAATGSTREGRASEPGRDTRRGCASSSPSVSSTRPTSTGSQRGGCGREKAASHLESLLSSSCITWARSVPRHREDDLSGCRGRDHERKAPELALPCASSVFSHDGATMAATTTREARARDRLGSRRRSIFSRARASDVRTLSSKSAAFEKPHSSASCERVRDNKTGEGLSLIHI